MSRKMKRKKLTIIIPVFNEEENIDNTLSRLKSVLDQLETKYSFNILFSDNCSTDNSFALIKKQADKDPTVKAIRLARNYGFQKSLLTAYRHAEGDATIQMDCDLQDPPEVIPSLIKKWEDGHDVVVGVRTFRDEAFFIARLRRLFYFVMNKISDATVIPNAGDFRLIDRSVLDRLHYIKDANPYTRGLVSLLAVNETGVPYSRPKRAFGESKFPIFKLFALAMDGFVSNSMIPLRCAVWFGVFLLFLALALLIYFISGYFFFENSWPKGYATLVVLLTISMAANSVLIGVLGEYIGRIYDEVRTRPLTIISEYLNFNIDKKNG